MDVKFTNDELELLENNDCQTKFATNIIRGYRKVMKVIRAAKDQRDFAAMRSLNFKKLKGARSHQHSFRVTKQWRLIVEVASNDSDHTIIVREIMDYH